MAISPLKLLSSNDLAGRVAATLLAMAASMNASGAGMAEATQPQGAAVAVQNGQAGEVGVTLLPTIIVTERSDDSAGKDANGYLASRSTTFTKTDTPLKEVPASVSVIPAQLMKDQTMRSLADVIRYVPGASVHQGEGNRDQFILRGVSTSADLYIDGIRDDAQVFRDLYNLERVEVLKGTAGMVFGRGGAGGVVNRVAKQPVFRPLGEATLAIGSWNQLRASIDTGNKLGAAMAWRVNAMLEKADSFRNGFDLKRQAVNPVVTTILDADTTLTAGVEILRDERTADRGIPARNGRPLDTDPATFFGNASQSRARASVDAVNLLLEHDFGVAQFRNSFRVTRYDKFYQNVYADNANASSVDAAGTLKLAAYNNANRRTNIFNQSDLTTKFTTSGVEHTLLAGLELGHQDSTNLRKTGFFGALSNQTSATVSILAPFATVSAFRANGTDADNNVKADIAAVYVQDQLALGAEWKLLAGVRYDRFKVAFDDRRSTTKPIDLARTDSEFSPRMGLIWSPNSTATYYASYSYSFLPSAEQLSLAPNTADLAPERARNYELGGRWDLAPRLTLSAAAFRLDRNEVRSPDPLHPGFFIKTGQQRTEGVELGLQGEITSRWQIYGGYSHLNGRIARTTSAAVAGARLQLVPEQMWSLWNRFSFGPNWNAGLGVVHQSTSFANVDNVVQLPAFTRADAAVYYTFHEGKARLSVNVENLLDKKYFPTADGNNNISPGAPRNARLTLSTSF
jgi:catecholate siderophore receptor